MNARSVSEGLGEYSGLMIKAPSGAGVVQW
jgi:hypothetical protein